VSAPEPRENPRLFGHAAAERMLAGALAAGRMHHAWLIAGPSGVGKATLAYRFARRLLAGIPPGGAPDLALDQADPVFRRVAAASHADLRTIARGIDPRTKRLRGEISVDDVRAAGGFLRLTPAEGGWRVVVIDRADELNRNAANALLKMLEEPPPRAVLLLVCDAPGRMLPTIRSRCRRLTLRPLDEAAMEAALAFLLPDQDEPARARLAALADGSPGRALTLAEAEGLRIGTLVDEVLAALAEGGTLGPARAYAVADALGRTDDAFATFMELLRAGIAGAVRDALRGVAEAPQSRLAARLPPAAWSAAWSRLGEIQADTARLNLDKRQAVVTGLGLL
jgi:DNA polymerase-3 subunit delta'